MIRNEGNMIMIDTMTGEAFAEQYGVTFDAVMTGSGTDSENWERYEWKVTLTNARGEALVIPFYTGMMAGEPTVSGVLSCLASDSEARDLDFEDWADDLGYDTDSRKAYATWEACVKQAKDVYAWCVSEVMWEDFQTVQD